MRLANRMLPAIISLTVFGSLIGLCWVVGHIVVMAGIAQGAGR